MRKDRRELLHLIAIGRLSPTEAERLIFALNEGRETVWALAACIALSLCAEINKHQWLPGILAAMHSLMMSGLIDAQHAVSLVNSVIGGIV